MFQSSATQFPGVYGRVPQASSLTQLNFTGGTATNHGQSLYLTHTRTAAADLTALVATAPATPWTFTALVGGCVTTDVAGNGEYGVCFSDGTKFVTFGWRWDYVNYYTSLMIRRYTTATSTGTSYLLTPGPGVERHCWMRISDDGTNRITSYSADGYNFVTLHSVTRTDHLTATQYGIYVDPANGGGSSSGAVAMSVKSWLVT